MSKSAATQCGVTFHEPETPAEEILFRMYLREKHRADRYRKERDAERQRFTTFRARGVARGIARRMKVSHNDKAGN